MQKIQIFIFVNLLSISLGYAISKEEFLKLPYQKRRDFPIIVGISSEYAIPREEFMKLSFEVRSTISLELARQIVQYLVQNVGKKEGDLDTSRLYNLSMSNGELYKNEIIRYGTICGAYRGYCENHFKAAEYCYKDYLEWKKYELGQPALWEHPGGDAHPLSRILALYSDYNMYKEWAALYSDYNEFWWKRYAAGECKLLTSAGPDCAIAWLKSSGDYQAFLKDWEEIRRKAKTIKPKPLSVQVQVHEDFYNNNVKKVLGALEYYRKNDVRFMIEKATKSKNPAIVKKAKEYLTNWDKPAPENKKETPPVPEKK